MSEYTDKSAFLSFMYGTAVGRVLLKIVTAPAISVIGGKYMDSSISRIHIRSFAKKNGIDLTQCERTDFHSFNDFFTRKLKSDLRPIDMSEDAFISPCDGRLSVFHINDNSTFDIKGSNYSVSDLLGGDELSRKYDYGVCLVFRLCVNDYHRYCYCASGTKGDNVHIKGVLHTVRPIALRAYPVFVQNTREYTTIESDRFGSVTQIEVGALMIGRISNHDGSGECKKGNEKGMFLYGGSSIIVLLEKDRSSFPKEWFEQSLNGEEIRVKYGQTLFKATPSL